ncbi:MAG: histidinol-phosphatase [Clostridia bacterium]|nr:histidinol-phosphatase [Clostridia bacterium]
MNDYHMHTYRCKHAQGDVEDYAQVALKRGLKVMGVSDHTPLPDDWEPEIRMDITELPGYVETIEKAKEKFKQLTILKGLECEYQKKYYGYFHDELLGKWDFDYLALGQHVFYCDGEWVCFWKGMKGYKELRTYTEYTVMGIESGLFDYLAHPDCFGSFYETWDEEAKSCAKYIIEAAQAYNMPLEINCSGFRKGEIDTIQGSRYKYPLEHFWEMAAQYNVRTLINSDAHRPEELTVGVEKAQDIVKRYNLVLADMAYLTEK